MKSVFFLPFLPLLLLLLLLAGCGSAEAKEPMPEWPERLTGTYDDALTFTFGGAAPEYTGIDSQSGRMTALFPTEAGYLALTWRRLTSAETELLEDFLAGTGAETGVWELSTDPYSTLESYVHPGRGWYCLTAACSGLEEAALLRLVDGAVEAASGKETVRPRASSSLWLETLPWEKDWTCLLLGFRELDPAAGKEALRTLLSSYEWELADPAAEEEAYSAQRQTVIYLDEKFVRGTKRISFHLRADGDLYWNGTLRRPLGEGAGEELPAAWSALSETGVKTMSPPRLILHSGEAQVDAVVSGSYGWSYTTRIGEGLSAQADGVPVQEADRLSRESPILQAEGPVRLDFGPVRLNGGPGMPDLLSLIVFSGEDSALPVPEDGCFTPLAGLHSYSLSCSWRRPPEEPGGSGWCTYVLLIDGADDLEPEPPEG